MRTGQAQPDGISPAGAPSAADGVLAARAARLQAHVQALAGAIGERHVWRAPALHAAAGYIRASWTAGGADVSSQRFVSQGVPVENLEVEIRGNLRPDEILLIGAHYDTVRGSPGADDNASGVAALLELAPLLRDAPPALTVRLVALVNEEKPFDVLGEMGSQRYAARCRERRERIRAMLSLEMIGCFSDAPGSQRYPAFLRPFHPDRGDFLAVVGNWRSRRVIGEAVSGFRHADCGLPVRSLAAPERLVPAVGRSDHASFWQAGYAGMMLTDTAFNRNAHYHRATDTPDTLDYPRLARAVAGILGLARHAGRQRRG